ncbi:MAG: hypothetical protein H5U08_14765 [Thermogutta sp.]|uniref:hypothetical protein n=1 Tax=Thermogutta sp. TaxID=1962930 RepID=UPI001995B7BE|nr:hypothetical protein [Thermogutta sp.]MBC7353621.1 hypothetical protein [Thermogutta sp.]
MIRLRVLLALATILFLTIVSLAAVLSVAEVLAAVGNSAAATTFRYIGLGVGCVAGITLTVLVFWISLILMGELIREESPADKPLSEQEAGETSTDLEGAEEDLDSRDELS